MNVNKKISRLQNLEKEKTSFEGKVRNENITKFGKSLWVFLKVEAGANGPGKSGKPKLTIIV